MTVNEFLKETIETQFEEGITRDEPYRRPRPRIVCKDGFSISVQANLFTYCSPRCNDLESYTEVELGNPSAEPNAEIIEYAEEPYMPPTSTVYGYVPVELVDKLLEEHGGIDHW